MKIPEEHRERERFAAVFDGIVKEGWATGWGERAGNYVFSFTAEGLDRLRWLRILDCDVALVRPGGMSSAETMTILRALCNTLEDIDAPPYGSRH